VEELELTDPHTAGRVRLVEGDVTAVELGLSPVELDRLDDVDEVWHLAAVHDLAASTHVARRVYVGGTESVIAFCREQRRVRRLRRLHYVSSCYVSGRHEGEFSEDSLEVGQEFRSHYEETKYEAELLVRAAMAHGVPATVYRPGIIVGDSRTGSTSTDDGPYVLGTLFTRRTSVVVVPAVGDADRVRVPFVPLDFVVDAMDELSVLDESQGRTYALVDPDPPTVREVVTTVARHRGARVVWLPLSLRPVHTVLSHLPGMQRLLGMPEQAVDHLASPTTYSTHHTTRDLAASAVTCPGFASYAAPLLDGLPEHPGSDTAALT
jgi:thioester reductase-like protein